MMPVALVVIYGAAVSAVVRQNPDSLYRLGYEAYQADHHVVAVKHLFAYEQVAASTLSADRLRRVQAARQYSEHQLDLAVQTRQALLEHGDVSQVQLIVSGKMDATGAHADTVRLAPPQANRLLRPPLDAAPPAVTSRGAAARAGVMADTRALPAADSPTAQRGERGVERATVVPSEDVLVVRAQVDSLRVVCDSVLRENEELKARLRVRSSPRSRPR